jgi:cytochrome P450
MQQQAADAIRLDESFRFNPFDYRFHEEPRSIYRFLRDHSPVHYNEALNLYVLSRYADVSAALRNDGMFSFCHSDTYEILHPEKFADLVGFFCQDAPAHNGRRQLAGRPFTPRKSGALTPMVKYFGQHFLGMSLARVRSSQNGFDFMSDVAGPLSMAIIAKLIGLPDQDCDRIRNWIELTVSRDNGSAVVQPGALQASEQLLRYLYEFWGRRSREGADGDCIVDRIIQVVDSGDLSRQHGISFLWALCFAGQEATAKLLGNAIYQACNNRLDYVLHRSPNLVGDFLSEVMRIDSPAQIVYRTVIEEGELHGVRLKKGARAALLLGSANIDERAFGVDAADLRLGRVLEADLLTFGWGSHYCLGRHLGELEASLCLQQFFEQVRGYRIDLSRCTRVHTSTVHGFSSLPLMAIDLAE